MHMCMYMCMYVHVCACCACNIASRRECECFQLYRFFSPRFQIAQPPEFSVATEDSLHLKRPFRAVVGASTRWLDLSDSVLTCSTSMAVVQNTENDVGTGNYGRLHHARARRTLSSARPIMRQRSALASNVGTVCSAVSPLAVASGGALPSPSPPPENPFS